MFDAGRKTDMWYQAAGGMGEFRLQISFTPSAVSYKSCLPTKACRADIHSDL